MSARNRIMAVSKNHFDCHFRYHELSNHFVIMIENLSIELVSYYPERRIFVEESSLWILFLDVMRLLKRIHLHLPQTLLSIQSSDHSLLASSPLLNSSSSVMVVTLASTGKRESPSAFEFLCPSLYMISKSYLLK